MKPNAAGLIFSAGAMSLSSTVVSICGCWLMISLSLVSMGLNVFIVNGISSLNQVLKMFQIVIFCVFIEKK